MKKVIAAFAVVMMVPLLAQAQIYVKANATGANDGTSWTDAFTDLQSALAVATSGSDIWVATGTYTPTSTTDRQATFSLASGVALYGGFAGTEAMLSERAISANPTTLSGEIGSAGTGDNSYHVVTAVAVDATAVLDGFIISDGNANGGAPFGTFGGGMFCNRGDPTVRNFTFQDNDAGNGGGFANVSGRPTLASGSFLSNNAISGGAMYNTGDDPVVHSVFFSLNNALSGGAMYNVSAGPTITSSTFEANTASDDGGAIASFGASSPDIDRCLFEGNSADGDGGALYNLDGQADVNASTFKNNSALMAVLKQGRGGAIASWNCPSVCVTNCVFENNTADLYGGGIAAFGCDVTITNDTFYGNTLAGSSFTPQGGAIYTFETTGSVTNTISWGNDFDEVFCAGPPVPTYSHSMAEIVFVGGTNGGNMIVGANPLFVNASGGDFTLDELSPAIDAGDNNAPKITAKDHAGASRVVGAAVDIGAYEFDPVTGIPPVVGTGRAAPEIRSLYPNPFNPTVTVEFTLGLSEHVDLQVYDVAGRIVHSVLDESRPAEIHQATWDARNDRGVAVASGVYFIVLRAGDRLDRRKITLVK